jgi:hypothetical protein
MRPRYEYLKEYRLETHYSSQPIRDASRMRQNVAAYLANPLVRGELSPRCSSVETDLCTFSLHSHFYIQIAEVCDLMSASEQQAASINHLLPQKEATGYVRP